MVIFTEFTCRLVSVVDVKDIFFRANRNQFANISLRSITDDEVADVLALPSLRGIEDSADDEELEPPSELDAPLQTAEQLADSMITLSLEPRAKWQNLLNLDTIKVMALELLYVIITV